MRSYENAAQLACHIGNIPLPPAIASDADQVCALSGLTIPAGVEGLVRWTPSDKFRDQYDIVARRSAFVAQETAAIMIKPFMQKYSKSVISPDGWFGFASTNNVAWFLLNPPTPPFTMFIGLAQMEHILWRAPLSLSRELFFVRLGQRVLRIRHSRLMNAVQCQAACTVAVNEWCEESGFPPIKAPFLPIARELNSDTTGTLHPRTYDAASAGVLAAASFIEDFRQLTTGELWALGRIHAARNLALTHPEPLEIVS